MDQCMYVWMVELKFTTPAVNLQLWLHICACNCGKILLDIPTALGQINGKGWESNLSYSLTGFHL